MQDDQEGGKRPSRFMENFWSFSGTAFYKAGVSQLAMISP
jgi:hypothetical protein